MKKGTFLLVLLVIIGLGNSFAGNKYYLNDTSKVNDLFCTAIGNDANSGKTPAAPKLTWANLLTTYSANFGAGDTIFVDAGTYQEKNLTSPKGGVVIMGAGITLTTVTKSGSDRHFMVINANNTVLENMKVTGFDDNGDNGYAVQTLDIQPNITGVQIINVQIDNSLASSSLGGYPIEVESGAQVVFNGGGATCNAYNQNEAGGGLHIAGTNTNVLINDYQFIANGNNTMNGEVGDALRVDGGTVVVRNSRFEYNDPAGDLVGAAIGQFGGTLSVFDSYFSQNSTDLSYDQPGGSIYIQAGTFTIKRSIIASHQQQGGSSSLGAGIAFVGGSGEVDSCYFYSNVAKGGNDLYVGGGNVKAVNCKFTSGSSPIGTGGTGVLSITNCGNPTLYNNGGTLTKVNTTAPTYTAKPGHLPAYLPLSCVVIPCVHPVIAVNNITQTLCSYSASGTATASATGGTAPYTYSWSPTLNDTTASVNNLKAQSYTVSVSDATGCGSTSVVKITSASNLTSSISPSSIQNVTCFGLTNGNMTVTATGGVGTMTYNWVPVGGTGATAIGLGQGSYTVSVTDGNGCLSTTSASISQPAAALSVTPTVVNSTCGKADGSITLATTGGTTPYTYNWTSGGSGATGINLPINAYTITVTDHNGCTQVVADSIKRSVSTLSATASATKASTCGNLNGAATVNATGGFSPYTYSWSGGATAQTATGLNGGSYTVTVTDNMGCSFTAGANVNSMPSPTVALGQTSVTNILCYGGQTGKIVGNVSGGTGPFTYTWSNAGSSVDSVSGLSAGSYTLTVTDANSCTALLNATLQQPAQQIGITSKLNPSTCSLNNGSITVAGNGGTPGYKYSWSYNNTADSTITGLVGGSYSVTITDANSCSQSFTVTETQVTGLSLAVKSTTDVACYGGLTGKINLNVAGGTAPYTYNWTPISGTADSLSGIGAGSYKVIVNDINGCVDSLVQVVINQPTAALTIADSSVVVATCGNTNGSVTIAVQGGTRNYTYSWSGNGVIANDSSATNLGGGKYVVNVTDAHGCTTSSSFYHQPTTNPVISQFNTTNPLCNGAATGSATAVVTAGTPTYTYSWSNGVTGVDSIYGVVAGTYTLSVTDKLGCLSTQTVTINQPQAISITIAQQSIATCDSANGKLVANVSGGNGAIQYAWANSANTTATLSNIKAGTYVLTVTDANACTASATGVLNNSAAASLAITQAPATICVGQNATFAIAATGGTRPFSYIWSNNLTGSTNDTIQTVSPSQTTTYTVQVKDSAGCLSAPQSIQVVVNPPLTVKLSADTVNLCTGNSATITAHAAGGNAGAYAFQWSPNAGVDSTLQVNAVAQTYTVTLTDNNCSSPVTAIVPVLVNKSPQVQILTNPTILCGVNSLVNFAANPVGQGVTQTWNFGDQTPTSNTGSHTFQDTGVFNVSVTVDSNGCSTTVTDQGLITVLSKPTAQFTYAPNTYLQVDTVISFLASPVSSLPNYLWNFGDNGSSSTSSIFNPTHSYSDSGTYKVTLVAMASNGCKDTVSDFVHIIPKCDWPKTIPNVFSPNGDRNNDYFIIAGEAFNTLKCTIYNRWGTEVFQYNAKNESWDGHTFSSGPAPEGTYFYLFEGTCLIGNKQSTKQGFITIVR